MSILTSIYNRTGPRTKRFLDFNFRMWKHYPVHYLSVMSMVPLAYIFIFDADSRYMEAEKLAGPPIYRIPRRETVPSLEYLEEKYKLE